MIFDIVLVSIILGTTTLYGREKQFINGFLEIDDTSIYNLVLDKCKQGYNAFNIMNDLKNRRLFKRSYFKEISKISSPIKRMELWKKRESIVENEIANMAEVDAELVIIHKESEEGGLKSYRTFGRVTESGETPLMYEDRDGNPHVYDDRSPLALRKEPSQILYVFTKKEDKDKVGEVCKEKLC